MVLLGESGHGQGLVEVIGQPGERVANRVGLGVLSGQQREELSLPAGSPQVHDQLAGDLGADMTAMIIGHQGEGEVDTGGDTGGGPDVSVADVDGIGVHADFGVRPSQQLALRPVGGTSPSRR